MKRIALVTDLPFWVTGNGQNARTQALYQFLSQHSSLEVHYLGKELPPAPKTTVEQLTHSLKQDPPDLIIAQRLKTRWLTDLKLKNCPIYLDAHDLFSQRQKSFQQFNRKCLNISLEEEIAIFSKFDKVLFLQKEELELISSYLPKERLLLCPHPVEAQEVTLKEQVQTIGFLGGPSWPNIDGMLWFHDHVLPLLGELADKCVISGSIVQAIPHFFCSQMKKQGFVSSLHEHYQNTDIAINPCLYGSGLKIKTVEALAYGIPLVTTSVGAQGLKEEAGRAFLLADTPEEFALAIQRLASSITLRQRLATRAKEFAAEHFTPHRCFAPLLD